MSAGRGDSGWVPSAAPGRAEGRGEAAGPLPGGGRAGGGQVAPGAPRAQPVTQRPASSGPRQRAGAGGQRQAGRRPGPLRSRLSGAVQERQGRRWLRSAAAESRRPWLGAAAVQGAPLRPLLWAEGRGESGAGRSRAGGWQGAAARNRSRLGPSVCLRQGCALGRSPEPSELKGSGLAGAGQGLTCGAHAACPANPPRAGSRLTATADGGGRGQNRRSRGTDWPPEALPGPGTALGLRGPPASDLRIKAGRALPPDTNCGCAGNRTPLGNASCRLSPACR